MRGQKPGRVIGLKIETDRPEDSPQAIAAALAGAIQDEMNARSDLMEFKSQAHRERQKAKEMASLLVSLQEYNRKKKKALASGEEWKPSRMEPMEHYDIDTIKTQKAELLDRARDFDNHCNELQEKINESKRSQQSLQNRLKKLRG